ncbi:3-keto-5-aminohexanoate cleavage protein [Leisingera methylohalidivorans]|uniref:Aminotransferase class-III n=1 Tax=Leisingera methylohalidivorans DSM 14336 TaxID=999552 RepID=V9VWT0_9RHOB|nr:3-keto-5-aminohexanoate cleavage protein [Leisingera methylohalidivorans]AHD01795.1 aminotransferase class-III [Leisingera methylohalidivorans DSM 14336]
MAEYRLMVAPNGARRGRGDHPQLPVTPQQTAQTAAACFAAGAQALHLHVRDGEGRHSLDAGRYREALDAVRESVPGMAVQITTESAGIYDAAAQLACLEALRPAAASVSVREMARDPLLAARVYALSAEAGTEVQHILYGPDCIARLGAWYKDGTVPGAMRDAIFVLGRYTPPVLAQPAGLAVFRDATADLRLNWAVCAFGRHEHACLLAAIATGGDARIGFENNIETPEGGLLADNAASVAAFVQAARDAGHRLKEC